VVQKVQPGRDHLVTRQQFILARLADFCDYGGMVPHYERDPWSYMRSKLDELEDAVGELKGKQLADACDRFLAELAAGSVDEGSLAEFKALLDSYLSPGDFADVAIHLSAERLSDPSGRVWAIGLLRRVRAAAPFAASADPMPMQAAELYRRLGFDVYERILTRKPKTARRKRMTLRRMRRRIAEYCSFLHPPVSPDDTFSPFVIARVSAVLMACRRLLDRCR